MSEPSSNGKYATSFLGGNGQVVVDEKGNSDLDANTTYWQPAVPDVLLRIQRDVFQRAYDRGIIAGDLESNEGELASLEEHARSIAREAHRHVVDPTKHPH